MIRRRQSRVEALLIQVGDVVTLTVATPPPAFCTRLLRIHTEAVYVARIDSDMEYYWVHSINDNRKIPTGPFMRKELTLCKHVPTINKIKKHFMGTSRIPLTAR